MRTGRIIETDAPTLQEFKDRYNVEELFSRHDVPMMDIDLSNCYCKFSTRPTKERGENIFEDIILLNRPYIFLTEHQKSGKDIYHKVYLQNRDKYANKEDPIVVGHFDDEDGRGPMSVYLKNLQVGYEEDLHDERVGGAPNKVFEVLYELGDVLLYFMDDELEYGLDDI